MQLRAWQGGSFPAANPLAPPMRWSGWTFIRAAVKYDRRVAWVTPARDRIDASARKIFIGDRLTNVNFRWPIKRLLYSGPRPAVTIEPSLPLFMSETSTNLPGRREEKAGPSPPTNRDPQQPFSFSLSLLTYTLTINVNPMNNINEYNVVYTANYMI